MTDYRVSTSLAGSSLSNPFHLKDIALNTSGDESVFPASTLSPRSDCGSSSDLTSLLWTARSTSPKNILEDSAFGRSVGKENATEFSVGQTGRMRSADSGTWRKDHSWVKIPLTVATSSEKQDRRSPSLSRIFHMEENNTRFMPISATGVNLQRSRTPSPGMSKMLLSLSDHVLECPCTPNASTLYKNTRTHCNPSELGQQTYDECMFFTTWTNKLFKQSRYHFLITDLARDLGDGLTLLILVEMLVGEYPPQIHIKPALDVQKMENVQTCLDFLQHHNVSVNNIAAEDIVKGNLKVVLALCHCLYRHFTSHQANSLSHNLEEQDALELFGWVSKVTGKQVTGFQSFENGTLLCLLLNKILDNAIPDLVLEFGSPAEKMCFALKLSAERLGIVTSLEADDIILQRDRKRFLDLLNSLYLAYPSKTETIKIVDASESNTLRREVKKLQIREETVKDRCGSQSTYLKESTENRSPFSNGRLNGFISKEPPRVNSEIDGKRNGLSDLSKTLPNAVSKVVEARNGSLRGTKRELDELMEDLRLLQLEILPENRVFESHWIDKQRQDISIRLRDSNHSRKPSNQRREPGDVSSGKGILMQGSDKTSQLAAFLPKDIFRNDQDGAGKLPFGGCYLSEKLENFNVERKHEFFEESSVFKEYQAKPSFLDETEAFNLRNSGETVNLKGNDRIQSFFDGEVNTSTPQIFSFNQSVSENHKVPQEFNVDTKGISKVFDVEFCDLDATMRSEQENRSVERMLRVIRRTKLDTLGGLTNGEGSSYGEGEESRMKLPAKQSLEMLRKTRYGSIPGLSSETANVHGGLVSSSRSPTGKDCSLSKSKSDTVLLLSKQNTTNKPTVDIDSRVREARDSVEPSRHLQRTFSREKRQRIQFPVEKSHRSAQRSSLRANAHALTSLIRMSAKNAGASLSKEDL